MTAAWRAALTIAAHKLHMNLARDRMAQLFLFVLPLAMTVLVGAAGANSARVAVAVVEPHDTELAAGFRRAARGQPSLHVTWRGDRAAALELLSRQQVQAVLRPRADARGGVVVDVWSDRGRIDPALLSGPVLGLVGDATRGRAAADLAVNAFGGGRDAARRAAATAARVAPTERTVIDDGPAKPIGGFRFAAIGNLALFAFLTTFGTAVALLNDRADGQLERLLAAPIPRLAIVGGHVLARAAVGAFQVLVVVVASSVLFSVRWGSLWLLALLLGPFVLLAAFLGLVAATWYRSNEQASIVTGVVGFPAAMLGGCLWPLAIIPPALAAAGHLVPHAWVMDGLLEVAGGGGLRHVWPEAAVLVGASLVAGLWCLHRVPRFIAGAASS